MGRKRLPEEEKKRRRREYRRKWLESHREQANLNIKRCRERLRLSVLKAYGGESPRCACCGESEIKFLSIDHIEGKGRLHRKSLGGTQELFRWLKKNNYPPGFQVLCYNCNLAKGFYGVCPHKEG